MLVPRQIKEDGIIADALVDIGPDDPEWQAWVDWQSRKNYAQRVLSPAERRVDFARIKRIYDEDALALNLTLRGFIATARDALLQLVERQAQATITADFAQSVRLDVGREFSRAVEDYLVGVWRKNRDWALEELPEVLRDRVGPRLQRYHLPGQHEQQSHAGDGGGKDAGDDRPLRLRGPLNEPDAADFHYHATNLERAFEIAGGGLVPHGPSYGTDQSAWPDGSRQKRSYFGTDKNVWQFAPENGQPVALRIKQTAIGFKQESTGDWYVTGKIPADQFEILTGAGWRPLTNLATKKFASAFKPDVAGDYFRNRALLIKGLVDDDLTKQAKYQLFEHLKGGRILNETMGNLREVFEPWVGDPRKIVPSGLTGLAEDILQNYRLENIIRTETTTALNQGRAAVADAAGDFVIGFQHSSILDDRTTEVCQLADGIKFRKDDPRAVKLQPPLHFQCFPSGLVKLYTANGWRRIKDIRVGDQVLTHKGRFRPVTQLHNGRKYKGDVIKFIVAQPKLNSTGGRKDHQLLVTVTPEHPVLTESGWIAAHELSPGMNAMVAAVPCRVCGKPVPLGARRDPQFCSRLCNAKAGWATLKMRWADPKWRVKRSKEISTDMQYQYLEGIRNGKKVTEAAHHRVRQLISEGKFSHVYTEEFKAASSKGREASAKWRKAVTIDRMGKKNPIFKHPDLIPKWVARMKAHFEAHPEKRHNLGAWVKAHPERHPNRTMGLGASKPQKLLFKRAHKFYGAPELNFPIKVGGCVRYIDVALPLEKIALEYDGSYWHKDAAADQLRDQQLQQAGWTVLRYRDVVPTVAELKGAVDRVLMNHAQEYQFVKLPIVDVKRERISYRPKKLYNVAVAEDESYVVRGIVFHNCRSIDTYVTTIDTPVEWTSEEDLDEVVREIPKGFK